jgi:hypothetical protein
MASAESKPNAHLSAAAENDSSMNPPLEDGNGEALAYLGSAQNQGDAYREQNREQPPSADHRHHPGARLVRDAKRIDRISQQAMA